MRIISLFVALVLVGVAIGIASAYWSVGPSLESSPISALRGVDGEDANVPVFKIDATTHKFGAMERGTTREHSFRVTNSGTAPLEVRVGETSCKCTVGNVDNKPIEPGESVDVTLSWIAKAVPGPFRQTASLITNDPYAARVELSIEGDVTDVRGIEPQQWYFDRLIAGEERTQSIYVMSYRQDNLEILSATMEDAEASDWFSIATKPVPRSELPDSAALAGVRIDVTTQQGLPLGGVHHWVVLKTNLPEEDEFPPIAIMGNVTGDIHVRGPAAWNETANAVLLGAVDSSLGKEVKLFLSVKGEHAEGIEFEVASCEPDDLDVEFGEAMNVREGVVHVPFTVRVRQGRPPVIRNGSEQGEAGRIVLKSNHPVSPEIGFAVRYTIRRNSTR
ncbi:MAG: DUF1573 domain-containing protein [Aeoliella sp.]